jgi:hypothetical protein
LLAASVSSSFQPEAASPALPCSASCAAGRRSKMAARTSATREQPASCSNAGSLGNRKLTTAIAPERGARVREPVQRSQF